MKIMFISDIHGSVDNLNRIKEIYDEEKPNKIIILGDIYYGGINNSDEIDNILLHFNGKYLIRGNCDREIDVLTSPFGFMNYYYFEEFNKKIFATHGNRYNIYNYPEFDFDIMIYGHTHVGMIRKEFDKIFLNPGSISYPRGGSKRSYMIIDEDGIYLKDLDKNIIDKLLWK